MLTAAQVLAQNNFGDTRTGGLAGPMGLFLIVLLATATVLLIRNMNSRLRRLPDHFPAPGERAVPGGAGVADAGRAEATVVDPTDGTLGQDSRSTTPKGPEQHGNG
ncbi:hypothetical protein E1258_04810 [Micromonospora sp. KC207]|uniref:Uncharacterized protein n=1 Tax=Micromonospora carbonacea TaxID=47853 RepID=A0A7D6CC96_9ACTN|nr:MULTISPECIES: hypothetical protein [unclassified Micromonospora]EEP73429.1 hypothetical protein MCAG_03756 [Micromonospora sp. ATCC 39149]QLJ99425.1 hypothetical protein HZU44_04620 [Micromonospora carbonacea]TDC65682.1 hypothetical protein E1258_04810 [Micromonospora sp. KC207]